MELLSVVQNSLKAHSHITFALVSTSTFVPKFNIASVVMQMQTQIMALDAFSAFAIASPRIQRYIVPLSQIQTLRVNKA